jgi:FkbM family methyltransferase
MEKSLLDESSSNTNEWIPEPFYHDLYNDLFYKDIIFPGKRNGYFVEVGALDGLRMSQSYLFEKALDWCGIVVEPNPVWKDALFSHRDCNVSTNAISNVNGIATFESREIAAFSGLKSSVNASRSSDIIGEFDVETITLCDLFDKCSAPDIIDWVSIDTEGAELDILNQFFLDNKKYKINLLSFETLDLIETNKIMANQPYLKIKNPYLDFIKISNQGLLKFDPLTGDLFKSPYREWKYEGSLMDESIKNPDFEQYYVHIDYLKNNLHLKTLLIN